MLKKRILTVAVILPLFLLFLWLGGWWLAALLALVAVLSLREYLYMMKKAAAGMLLTAGGILYILLGLAAFWLLKQMHAAMWLLIVIWLTDTAAFFFGRMLGKHKLASKISPNKTVEGFVAGLLAGMLFGAAYGIWIFNMPLLWAALASVILSAVGQFGDLLESKVKRIADVKDSGNLLPGHGGMLDRCDSILLGAIFFCPLLICLP